MALSRNIDLNICYSNKNLDISLLKNLDNNISNKISKIVTIPNAYIKIIKIEGDKANILLAIGIFDKKEGIQLKTDYYNFSPSVADGALNFIKQGYEQLKVNKYQGAIDLLDEGQTP